MPSKQFLLLSLSNNKRKKAGLHLFAWLAQWDFYIGQPLTKAQYFDSFKASYDASNEASQKFCFDYAVLLNKTFDKPCTRHRTRL